MDRLAQGRPLMGWLIMRTALCPAPPPRALPSSKTIFPNEGYQG